MTNANKIFFRTNFGASNLGLLLFVFLLLAAVYFGWQVLPFYYSFYELQGHMESQARVATEMPDSQIRRNLMTTIKKLEIPIESEDDLKIVRAGGKIMIELEYEEDLLLDFGEGHLYDLWTFEFHPYAEELI